MTMMTTVKNSAHFTELVISLEQIRAMRKDKVNFDHEIETAVLTLMALRFKFPDIRAVELEEEFNKLDLNMEFYLTCRMALDLTFGFDKI
jgi:hypothetical protein